jgi:hypothetical protein
MLARDSCFSTEAWYWRPILTLRGALERTWFTVFEIRAA